MTERLVIDRTDDGDVLLQMTTALGTEGHLIIELRRPASQELRQMPMLELQADLMARALELLKQKLAAARRLDGQPPTLP